MSNIACEMLPGRGFIMRRAEECSEADRAKNFYCIHCRVRVYLHLPEAGRGISPYFSADSEPHKKECPNYREDLFRTVTHLDHTGSGVDLSELMKGFRQVDHRPRPEGGKGKSGGPISGIEKGPAEETDRPIRREARTPKTGENKPDDKYLAMAAWSPYIETDKICAYIGHLPSTGCFHRLPPRYDCDQE